MIRQQILFDLEHPPQRYVPGRVVVVFKPGVTIGPQDHRGAAAGGARRAAARGRARQTARRRPHPFTNDARTNLTLMKLGVDRADRLFANVDRAR